MTDRQDSFVSFNRRIEHSGVKGQKWGVRRWQNEDGTLTAEGRIHYGLNNNVGSMTDDELRRAIARKKNENEYVSLATRRETDREKSIGKTATSVARLGSSVVGFNKSKYEADTKHEQKQLEGIKNRTKEQEARLTDIKYQKDINDYNKQLTDTLGTELEKREPYVGRVLSGNSSAKKASELRINSQELSDADLDTMVQRLRLEKEYETIVNPPKPSTADKLREGAQILMGVVGAAGTIYTIVSGIRDTKEKKIAHDIMSELGGEHLAHYGVKGQRHGVRKYQNEDGSLTDLGYQHYGIEKGREGSQEVNPQPKLSAREQRTLDIQKARNDRKIAIARMREERKIARYGSKEDQKDRVKADQFERKQTEKMREFETKTELKNRAKTDKYEAKQTEKTRNAEMKERVRSDKYEAKQTEKTRNAEMKERVRSDKYEAKQTEKTRNADMKERVRSDKYETEQTEKMRDLERKYNRDKNRDELKDRIKADKYETKQTEKMRNAELKYRAKVDKYDFKQDKKMKELELEYNRAEMKDKRKNFFKIAIGTTALAGVAAIGFHVLRNASLDRAHMRNMDEIAEKGSWQLKQIQAEHEAETIAAKTKQWETKKFTKTDKTLESRKEKNRHKEAMSSKDLESRKEKNRNKEAMSSKDLESRKEQNRNKEAMSSKDLESIKEQNRNKEAMSSKDLESIKEQNRNKEAMSSKDLEYLKERNRNVEELGRIENDKKVSEAKAEAARSAGVAKGIQDTYNSIRKQELDSLTKEYEHKEVLAAIRNDKATVPTTTIKGQTLEELIFRSKKGG